MIEHTKIYNGHSYSGVLLQACVDGYQQGRADAIDEVYNIVTDFLINSNSELDFNLALQNKILDLKYK